MFNNNSITAEVRITRDPERSDRADVVKAGGAIFQGKKDDNKTPIWVDLNGWKYTGKCLETLAKNDVVIVTGSLSQEFWNGQDGQEKSKLVITCETIAKKVWANNQQGSQQSTGYQNQNSGHGYNQNQAGFQQPATDDIPW